MLVNSQGIWVVKPCEKPQCWLAKAIFLRDPGIPIWLAQSLILVSQIFVDYHFGWFDHHMRLFNDHKLYFSKICLAHHVGEIIIRIIQIIINWLFNPPYPLVNVYIAIENHHAINGKNSLWITILLNYQRVNPIIILLSSHYSPLGTIKSPFSIAILT